jgi:hypothetical protein
MSERPLPAQSACPECKGAKTMDYGTAEAGGDPVREFCDTCKGSGTDPAAPAPREVDRPEAAVVSGLESSEGHQHPSHSDSQSDDFDLREVMVKATMDEVGCDRTEAERIVDRVADRCAPDLADDLEDLNAAAQSVDPSIDVLARMRPEDRP